MGEHLLCKQGVIGSIPFTSTTQRAVVWGRRTERRWAGAKGEGEGGKWVIWSGRVKGWRKSEQRVLWVLCVLPLAVRSEIGCSLKIGKK